MHLIYAECQDLAFREQLRGICLKKLWHRLKSTNLHKKLRAFFTDTRGQVVIAQFPNTPLITTGIFFLLAECSPSNLAQLFSWAGSVTLLYWSYLEIRYGASPWRQFLGTVVAIYTLAHLLQQM